MSQVRTLLQEPSGLFVKWLRHRPFTAGSRVRISHRSPWAISSAGRASALQAECQQFDPVIAHQKKAPRDSLRGVFLYPEVVLYFHFPLYSWDSSEVTPLLSKKSVTESIPSHSFSQIPILLMIISFSIHPTMIARFNLRRSFKSTLLSNREN